jgi:hypothetical protein
LLALDSSMTSAATSRLLAESSILDSSAIVGVQNV